MTKYGQPAISRETRLLLVTIVVSIAALWVLARIRFQEHPATSAPVPPVLAQLRSSAGYTDLARLIADIRPAVNAAIFAAGGAPALRVREDAGVTLGTVDPASGARADRATGLAVVPSPSGDAPGLMPWVPRLLDYPRYLVAAELAGESVALRPVFVSGLFPTASALWAGEIWQLPPATALAPGAFVFTTDGALAGLTIDHRGRAAIVPAALLLSSAERLLDADAREPGELGITVQPLSPAVAAASGARTGVVVTVVDPNGPAAGTLVATDVIDALDGQDLATLDHWRARVARLNAGDTIALRVRAAGEVLTVQLTAAAPVAPEADPRAGPPLGLRLRAIPRVGAEVLSVEPRSRAARAGLQPGDLITVAGRRSAPSPAQVTRAFGDLPEGGSLMVAVTRGSEHRVAVVDK